MGDKDLNQDDSAKESEAQAAQDSIDKKASIPPPAGAATGGTPEGFADLKDTVRLVIIVLQVGVAGCIIAAVFGLGVWYATYASAKQASYEDLTRQIEMQQNEISNLSNALEKAHVIQ